MTVLAYKDKTPIMFVHIPKTGGTSIGDWMVNNVGGEYYLHKHFGGQHADLRLIKKLMRIKPLNFDETYMFTVVRNPWDRLLSGHLYFKRTGKFTEESVPFDAFLRGDWKPKLATMGNPQVNYVGSKKPEIVMRFENLEKDFEQIQELFDCDAPLPVTNTTEHKHYTEHYDDITRKLVEDRFKEDIERFNYKFGEN